MKEGTGKNQIVVLFLVGILFAFGVSGAQSEETGYSMGPILPSDIQISDYAIGSSPDVAFDGTNYLVVWYQDGGIVGRFVNRYGSLVAEEFIISPSGQSCAISFNGTDYLIVYNTAFKVVCRFVTPEGDVGPEITIENEKPEILDVAFAPDSSTFLVVWFNAYDSVASWDVKARVVSYSGVLQGEKFVIGNGEQMEFFPSVASDGTDFLVVWCNRPDPNGEGDVYGARVDSSGALLDLDGFAICTALARQKYPQVSFDTTTGNYLVVWDDTRSGYPYDIYGSRVSQSGQVLDGPGGIVISDNVDYLLVLM